MNVHGCSLISNNMIGHKLKHLNKKSKLSDSINNYIKTDSKDIYKTESLKIKSLSLSKLEKDELVNDTVYQVANVVDSASNIVQSMKSLVIGLMKNGASDPGSQWMKHSIKLCGDLLNLLDKGLEDTIKNSPVRDELLKLKQDTFKDNPNLNGLETAAGDPNKIVTFNTSALGLDNLDLDSEKGLVDALGRLDSAATEINKEKKFVNAMSIRRGMKLYGSISSKPDIEMITDLKNNILENSVKIIKAQANLSKSSVKKLLN